MLPVLEAVSCCFLCDIDEMGQRLCRSCLCCVCGRLGDRVLLECKNCQLLGLKGTRFHQKCGDIAVHSGTCITCSAVLMESSTEAVVHMPRYHVGDSLNLFRTLLATDPRRSSFDDLHFGCAKLIDPSRMCWPGCLTSVVRVATGILQEPCLDVPAVPPVPQVMRFSSLADDRPCEGNKVQQCLGLDVCNVIWTSHGRKYGSRLGPKHEHEEKNMKPQTKKSFKSIGPMLSTGSLSMSPFALLRRSRMAITAKIIEESR